MNFYIQLRERDTQSTNKYASRITVRQLESMVRLSEAMAKMECSDEVGIFSWKWSFQKKIVFMLDLFVGVDETCNGGL